MVEYVLIFLIALVVMLLLNKFIIINARIPSASMEDTVMTGDRLIGNRLAYKNDIPQRFDVIIFKFPDNESELYIKRIIGLPGETVTITDGKVYINDSTTPLDDSFTKEIPASTSFGPYYVPSNCYFVMGDNRNNSYDSRYWTHTFVKSEQILGKAMFRYYPFNKISKVD
ncbi:MAG: signal peptidase I [Lachnospiraceae bacterium]